MSTYPRQAIDDVLAKLEMPAWVERVQAEPMVDQYGQAAVQVTIVARSGERDVFNDGGALNELSVRLLDALMAAGIDLFPFPRFVSADEIEAA